MKYIFIRIFVIILAVSAFSCSDGEDGIDGTNGVDGTNGEDGFNVGLEYLVFAGDITDEEAAEVIAEDFGKNTNTILVLNTTNLTALELPETTNLASLEVTGNEKLQSLTLPNLESVVQDVLIEDNAALTTVTFENLTRAKEFSINNNSALISVSLNKLLELENLRVYENSLLESINLSSLASLRDNLFIRNNNGLTNLDVRGLENIFSLNIRDNEKLFSVDLPNLFSITKLRITENSLLESFNAPKLAKIDGDFSSFSIGDNEGLTSIIIEALESSNTDLNFRNNPKLTTVSIPNLIRSRSILVSGNEALLNINLDKLQTIDERLFISGNERLQTISFAALTDVNTYFSISSNDALETVSFPVLTSTGNTETGNRLTFSVTSNPLLNSLDFSSLITINANFSISGNIALTSLSFPLLTTVTGSDGFTSFKIDGNDSILNIAFPSLEVVNVERGIDIREDLLQTVDFGSLVNFSILNIDSTVLVTSVNLSAIQDFSNLDLASPGGLSTTAIDGVLNRLVNIAPAITGKRISITGVLSEQALIDVETLRANSNSVSLFNN